MHASVEGVPCLIEGAKMAWVRHLVGKKKRRYIEDGYDLDLTCILSLRGTTIITAHANRKRVGWVGASDFGVWSLVCPSKRDGDV